MPLSGLGVCQFVCRVSCRTVRRGETGDAGVSNFTEPRLCYIAGDNETRVALTLPATPPDANDNEE